MSLYPEAPSQGIREQIEKLSIEARETIASLGVERQQVDEHAGLLESPDAAYEYLDFFIDLFGRTTATLDRISSEMTDGIDPAHAAAQAAVIRQIANDVWIDEQRCLEFRDKWINKPLPHEEVRPLLNRISIETRDQLLACQTLDILADRLDALARVAPVAVKDTQKSFNRRALFTRLFRR